MHKPLLLALCLIQTFSTTLAAPPPDCSTAKIQEILAPATPASPSVKMDCNASLSNTDTVTKELIFEGAAASGTSLDCNGAKLISAPGMDADRRIMITSRFLREQSGDQFWEPVANVTIRNCRIEGSIRIRGEAINGEDQNLTASSHREGHTQRVQDNAPHHIVLERDSINGHGWTPVYFGPGVHDSRLVNSTLGGYANAAAIYLDAESARNTIKGNSIVTETRNSDSSIGTALSALHFLGRSVGASLSSVPEAYREVISIDGSADNMIIDNYFGRLDHGGIYLYRNCGEAGNIRHQTPSGNAIINNIFYYKKFDGHYPAIWLSSRNGSSSFCDQDKGYPLGSSLSDLDYASGNFVVENQFYKFEPNAIIRDNAGGNYYEANTKVNKAIPRKASCIVQVAGKTSLLPNSAREAREIDHGLPSCRVQQTTCNDGELSVSTSSCETGYTPPNDKAPSRY